MKRLMMLVFLSGLILGGCQSGDDGQANPQPPKTIKQERAKSAFSPLPAADVIESGNSGEIKNLNRFNIFLEHVDAKEPDHIQIRHFTTEGDPISRDIQFDGSVFKSILDSSRDKYGSGGISETVCTELGKIETAERTDYQLEGCEDGEAAYLLVVEK